MRVRRHHAWGAVLIVLFVLPVLQPDGVPALERPVAGFFAWFSRVPVLNPHLWGSQVPSGDDEGSGRARALEAENAVLREQYAERLHFKEDLEDLKRAFATKGQGGLDRLPRVLLARVLRSTDAVDYRRSLLIDRGEEDGLIPGLAVVSGRVLLGRVERVHARSALVKLVTDRRSRLEVAVRTSANRRLIGYVRGRGRGRSEGELEVRFVRVPDEAGRILPGATVFSSNADERVPSSLIVGYVSRVFDHDLDGMPQIRIRPALDLGRSTFVYVLLPPGPPVRVRPTR